MKKRILLVLLSLLLVLTNGSFAVAFETVNQDNDFYDMPNDWSTVALNNAVDNSLLKGYKVDDKTFIYGKNPVTRAEMATVINRAFGATVKADISGTIDVVAKEWYAEEMEKAVKMKAFSMDTQMRPNDKITRQEAFVVLSRVFKVTSGDKNLIALNNFSDKGQISEWAKKGLCGMAEDGYIKGSDGMLLPLATISRAEFAVVMDNLVKQYITQPGIKNEVAPSGNVLVRSTGVTLKNLTVKGDLIIADGVDEGEAILDGVIVEGKIIVRGGGVNSIIIRGNSDIGKIILSKTTGEVRVVVEGDADVEIIYIDDGSQDVILQGLVGFMEIAGDNITVRAELPMKGHVIITGKSSFVLFEDIIVGDTTIPASGGRNPGGGGSGGTQAPALVSVSSISLDPTEMILTVGGIQKITATVSPTNATNKNITWASSDESIATIDQNGSVTGVTVGSVTITGISADDSTVFATSRVTVGYYVDTIVKLENALLTVSDGDTIVLAAGRYELTKTLEITKSIKIIGPQANVDPRTSANGEEQRTEEKDEAILTGQKKRAEDYTAKPDKSDESWLPSIFNITAHDVVINGLTVERTKDSLIYATTPAGLTGLQIINNIVRKGRGNEGIKVQKAINPLIANNYIEDIKFGGDAIEVIDGQGFRIINNEIDGCDSANGTINVSNKAGGNTGIIQGNLIQNTGYHFAINVHEGDGDILIDQNTIIDAKTGGIFIYKNTSVLEALSTTISITNNKISGYGTSPVKGTEGKNGKPEYLEKAASAIAVSFNLLTGIQPRVIITDNITLDGATNIAVLCFGGGTSSGAIATDLAKITVSGNSFDNKLIKLIKTTGPAISL